MNEYDKNEKSSFAKASLDSKSYDFGKIEQSHSAKASRDAQEYDFKSIEARWSKKWKKSDYGKASDNSKRPKHYHLVEFPYPSGAGLHVGHCMGYGASDAYCRMKRMRGFEVMFPIGWDAFGLPTENYAIKNKIKPQRATADNVANFKKQMRSLAYSFDWDREINTIDPNYYKWTQWIFLQFYKHAVVDGKLIEVPDDDTTTPRLAYQAKMPVNWCPSCKINLANEEVISGKCERCGAETEKRMQKQWILRITKYADRLIDDLSHVDYEDKIKVQQVNWIGKSNGSSIRFKIKNKISNIKDNESDLSIEVFTTRADTLFGATYVVLAPESDYLNNIKNKIENIKDIEEYIKRAKNKSDIDRTDFDKEKTGVELKGVKSINPINDEEIPIFVADYVLAGYGTGAVMAVPAHDSRDFEFAKKYHLPIKYVVEPKFVGKTGNSAVKPNLEFKKRNAICAVVRNPKNDKYLCISWNSILMHGLVTGGIEHNEDLVETARREIEEETGYKNFKFIKVAPLAINTFFYHQVKKENRWAHFQYVFFDLENEDRDQVDKKEAALHEVIWKSKDELKDFFTVFEGDYLADLLKNGDKDFANYGILTNSGDFSELESRDAIKKITEKLKEIGAGDFAVNYKLRDWIFSRQHYWGESIPIVHCDACGLVPVPEEELPLVLPEVENYEPTDTGESPLAKISDWVNVKCPVCGRDAKRETDTMPNWAGSSWYYLAYALNKKLNIKNKKYADIFKESQELRHWMPVDLYNGGMEHTTLHLLYSRFWHKFLFDLRVVPGAEPYQKRIAHGIILGTDGQKMSKSRGNTISPEEMIAEFGADTLRAYIMFIGPYDQESAWNMNGIQGVHRFIKKVWNNCQKSIVEMRDEKLDIELHKTIKGVSEDIEHFSMNTYIAKLMEFNNLLVREKLIPKNIAERFLILLSPAMPYVAEELWKKFGYADSIFNSEWPKFDQGIIDQDKLEIPIQINAKVRHRIHVSSDISDEEMKKLALAEKIVIDHLAGKEPKKVIVVPKKLISIVV